MIVPDTNLLVYVYNEDAPQHSAARRWWERLLGGTENIGVPWIVATGFIRVISNRRITASEFTLTGAAELVNNWFSRPHVGPIDPGPAHMDYFRQFLNVLGGGPNLVPDAHIAAIAMEFDAEVHTYNTSDFSRFPEVRWRNPIT